MKTIVDHLSDAIDLPPASLDEAVLTAAVNHLELAPDLARSLAGRTF